MGTLFTQETQGWAEIVAKKHCGGGPFEEAIVQMAFLKIWRQRISVALQIGSAAAIRACVGCQTPRGSPEALRQAMMT